LLTQMGTSIGQVYADPRDYNQDNYYSRDQGLKNSHWQGKLAEPLGLADKPVALEEMNLLLDGKNLQGEPLRQHQAGKSLKGLDITNSHPKSWSLAVLVEKNEQLHSAAREANTETLTFIENHLVHSRQRKGGKEKVQTGNALFFTVEHDDSRSKDPQLHYHNGLVNFTQCPDGKYRALDGRQLLNRENKQLIGLWHNNCLAYKAHQLGHATVWDTKGNFELVRYNGPTLRFFSQRSNEIEAELAAQGLNRDTAHKEKKDRIAHQLRKEKTRDIIPEKKLERVSGWQADLDRLCPVAERIVPDRVALERAYQAPHHPGSTAELLDRSALSLSQHRVAFSELQLLKQALLQNQGQYHPQSILAAIEQAKRQALIQTNDGRLMRPQAVHRDLDILSLARRQQQQFTAIATVERCQAAIENHALNQGQSDALKMLVTTRDGVVCVQGDAGVGKSRTLGAFREIAEAQGDQLRGLAPSAAAELELANKAGFQQHSTLDRYLLESCNQLPRGEILVVDEAGMIGSHKMQCLLEKALQLDNRVILTGDVKQLGSIEAGNPFLMMQQRGIATEQIWENKRQQHEGLKHVANLMASGQMAEAIDQLDHMGAIQEIEDSQERLRQAADMYLSSPVDKSTLLICLTNAERQELTERIRQGLLERGDLKQESTSISTLVRKDKNWDNFRSRQAASYEVGDLLRFRREYAQFLKGENYQVVGTHSSPAQQSLTLKDRQGNLYELNLATCKERDCYQSRQLEIRPGEQMRFTQNNRQADQFNGLRFTVEKVNTDGTISIQTPKGTQTLTPKDLAHSDYRYASTVHNAQGADAERTIWLTGSMLDQELTYVAGTRAKHEFVVLTENIDNLREAAGLSNAKENAIDLMPQRSRQQQTAAQMPEQPIQQLQPNPQYQEQPQMEEPRPRRSYQEIFADFRSEAGLPKRPFLAEQQPIQKITTDNQQTVSQSPQEQQQPQTLVEQPHQSQPQTSAQNQQTKPVQKPIPRHQQEPKSVPTQTQSTLEQQQEFGRLVYSTTQSFGKEIGQGQRQLKLPNGEILEARFPQYSVSVKKDGQVIFQAQHQKPQANSMSVEQMQVCKQQLQAINQGKSTQARTQKISNSQSQGNSIGR